MALKIHEYPIESLNFGDDDFYDIDFFDGVNYETRKIKGSTIKAGILLAMENVYNANGTLTGDRTLTGDNFILFFQELGQFIVHSHKNNVDNVIFEVRSQTGFESFTIRDHNTGDHLLCIEDGKVEITNAYFLPTIDGSSGDVMTTDGAGNVTFQPVTITNVFNSDGTLSTTRVVTMNGNTFTFDGGVADSDVQIQALNSASLNFVRGDGFKAWSIVKNTDGTENLRINRYDGTGTLLDTPIEINAGSGKVSILGAYELPQTDGLSGQVLTTDGLGQTSFQDIPTPTDPEGWTTIVKSANQDVQNDATPQDDTDLQFSVVAGGRYMIEMDVTWSANDATGDYKFIYALSSGTMSAYGFYYTQNVTSINSVNANGNSSINVLLQTISANIDQPMSLRIVITAVINDNAIFNYRFSNNNAGTTRISRTWKGSILRYKRIDI